jgi:hypothetical protein
MVYRDGCIALAGRPCWVRDTTGLGAAKLFRAHGDPSQSEQGEEFWRAARG